MLLSFSPLLSYNQQGYPDEEEGKATARRPTSRFVRNRGIENWVTPSLSSIPVGCHTWVEKLRRDVEVMLVGLHGTVAIEDKDTPPPHLRFGTQAALWCERE